MSVALLPLATAHLKGPHVDFAGLSPLIALLGGATIVLLVGLLGSRWIRSHVVPALSLVALGASLGLTIWQWHSDKSIVSGALRIDDLSLVLNLVLIAGGACTVLLAWRSLAAREAAHGEFYALLLTSIGGMSLLACAAEHGRAVRRPGAALDPPLRPVRHRTAQGALARVGAEVPDCGLGRVGHPALRDRDALRGDRSDRLRRASGRPWATEASPPTRSPSPASPCASPASASRPRSPPSTSGPPMSTRGPRPR